jgi:hypothetical protein
MLEKFGDDSCGNRARENRFRKTGVIQWLSESERPSPTKAGITRGMGCIRPPIGKACGMQVQKVKQVLWVADWQR